MNNIKKKSVFGGSVHLIGRMQTDAELLADYADRQSESAFAELVQRHVALVYSSALRQVGHSHQAQEITQAVFILLARKAGQLQRDTVLAGWLCRSAHLIARDQLKMEHRRQQREHTAYLEAAMDTPEPETQAAWQQLAPYLDEAIANLSETDRAALILRYFENRPWQEVAGLLQVTEDAAQKRAARALEKLRQLFTKRGVALTGTAIASAVTVNAVQAAPAGLGVTIATAALAGTTTSAAAVLAATTKTIAMTTLQKTLILATLTGFVGAGLYEARQAAQLRGQVQTLQQTQAPLAAQIRSLQNSLADATNRLADLMGENRRLQANVTSPELLKLRGEVTRLNQQLLAKTADPSQEPADPTVQTAKVLAERIKLLKENYAHWQGKTTAELALLTEEDWFSEVANNELNDEESRRSAMSNLRMTAKKKFSDAINTALTQFSEANSGQLPIAPGQLKPYLKPPLDSILDGYDIAQPGWVHPPHPNSPKSENATAWALIAKGSFTADGTAIQDGSYETDPEYDMTIVIYQGGWYSYGRPHLSKLVK